ncbi:MAG: hypothetical protein HY303_08055 [Candidatus Wallbacteria bacterium]|nr:hypothetical protein [Candidatus Wallbacteria bacterium]
MNRILWLKCRLTERAYSQSQGTVWATAAMLVFSFTGMATFALYLGMQLLTLGVRQSRELLHITLAVAYAFWLTFPLFGYRVNESLDVTRLFLYPLGAFRIFLGSFVGNLLELATVLVYPIFFAVAVALAPTWQTVPVALAVLACFLLHTVAASQLLLSLLLNLLKDRKMGDWMMVLVPLLIAFGVWGIEFGIFFSGAADAVLRLEISSYGVWFPCGVAAEALVALARGDWPELFYQSCVLAAITLLTVLFAGRAAQWMLTRGDGTGAGKQEAPGGSPADSRQFALLSRLVSHRGVAAVALKELKLLLREPQCRLVLVLFGLLFAGALGAGVFILPERDRDLLIPSVAFAAIFFFVGLLFNSFSLERTGLRFLVTAPVDPLVMLVGKNVAYWAVISTVSAGSAVVLAVAFGSPVRRLAFVLLGGQALLVAHLAIWNIVAVLSPYRLPSKGLVHQHRMTFGQVLWISFVNSIGLSLAWLLTLTGWLLLFPLLLDGGWTGFVEAIPASMGLVLGIYALLTGLAAILFSVRSEKVVAAVID